MTICGFVPAICYSYACDAAQHFLVETNKPYYHISGVAVSSADAAGHSRHSRTLAVGLTGCLLAYFVYGLTDAVALGARSGFLFWILLGLVASLFQINRRRELAII